jgi:hypothetical protein
MSNRTSKPTDWVTLRPVLDEWPQTQWQGVTLENQRPKFDWKGKLRRFFNLEEQ